MNQKQVISDPSAIQIKLKLSQLSKEAQKSFSIKKITSLEWFVQNVLKNKVLIVKKQIGVPRISLLRNSVEVITSQSSSTNTLNQIFAQENNINHLLIESENLVDIGFVLFQYLNTKGKFKKIQYPSSIMETIGSKMEYFFEKENKKISNLLRVNYVESFMSLKQTSPKQIYNKISEFELKELRVQINIIFEYLIKPWILSQRPVKFYEDLTQIIYWNIILDDDSGQKEQSLMSLVNLIENNLCPRKRSENAFTYFKLFGKLMDVLAINYRKEDPFKIQCLAPLLNEWQQQIRIDEITNWLEEKGKNLKPQQIQNIFRNTFHVGSTIFMFNLIELFSKSLKERKDFHILYHLFLSYIKKQYLDIVLPNSTFIVTYFTILEFYVIGFINQDRLEGQSQLDKLTNNLTSLLLNKKFTFKKHYEIIIMFYKIYQARFSYLSSVSRKFVYDLQRLSKYSPELIDIHNKIHQGAFREAGFVEQENTGFQQLNIKRTDRYRGMMNLGNTCYMNSFMQAMFMTKKFRSFILDTRDQQNIPFSKHLFYALSNLFTEFSTKTIGTDTEIVPQLFKMQCPQPFKQSWDQHDVAQFGRIYIQSLVNQLGDDSTKQRIEKIFSNRIRKTLICYNCKNEKDKAESIFDFILHLNKKDDNISVSKLLGEYFQGQKMEGQNQVYCERCRKKTDVLARPHPIRLAEYLLITIGLFEYSGGGKKIKKPFSFQFTINFSKILPNQNTSDQNYELYAFIVHIGNQVQRGHYICYARNLEQNPIVWYCFDDSYVTEREIQTVEDFKFGESETPYLLFYSTSKKKKSVQVNLDKISSQIYSR